MVMRLTAAADKSLGTVIFNRMEEFQSSKATFKALKNAVNHLLVIIELPKVLSESVHGYPIFKRFMAKSTQNNFFCNRREQEGGVHIIIKITNIYNKITMRG